VADRVARLASALRHLDVAEGDRVAILALNSDRYSEYILAVPWIGAVITPINIRWSPAEIGSALTDADCQVLFLDDAFVDLLPQLRDAVPGLHAIVYCGDGPSPFGTLSYEQLIADAEPVPDLRRGGDSLAGLFYTGGTTATPKGVMLSHANLLTSALGSLAAGCFLTPGCRYLHAAPMFHLADLGAWVAQTTLGGTHIIIPKFEPLAVLSAIHDHAVTDVLLVPTMIQLLVDHPERADYDTSTLRRFIYGASPISEALLDRAMKAFPQVDFVQAYGMTEIAPVATLLPPADHRAADPGSSRLRSAGQAAPHAEIRIVDEHDADVPTGMVGEILVRGGHVMLGYWNRPEETATALRGGWMHTGDAGHLDADGYLYVVDRIKDMIITGGENVYSAEVENALTKHPAVASCAVIGLPDPDWGERVHAVVILHDGLSATADELIAHTKQLIAGYKAPRSVSFVNGLPVSGAGKVLKRELREQYA
jgi:acyl-CoA synthetase (AMP-forming)/AMP-acid ligase II